MTSFLIFLYILGAIVTFIVYTLGLIKKWWERPDYTSTPIEYGLILSLFWPAVWIFGIFIILMLPIIVLGAKIEKLYMDFIDSYKSKED